MTDNTSLKINSNNFRYYSKKNKVTFKEIARQLGISHSTISRCVASGRVENYTRLKEIATIMKVDPILLLEELPLPAEDFISVSFIRSYLLKNRDTATIEDMLKQWETITSV